MPKDLTLAEVAEIVDLDVESLRRMARAGKLPGLYKIGGSRRMTRRALDKLRQLPKREK